MEECQLTNVKGKSQQMDQQVKAWWEKGLLTLKVSPLKLLITWGK